MIEHVAVIVPAANEEARIGGCLDALDTARWHLRRTHPTVTAEVVVVLDSCADGTSAVAARHRTRTIEVGAGNVGAARAAGTAAALAGRPTLRTVWTAQTDADSAVPRNWLSHLVQAADTGVEAVLGTVLPDLPDDDPAMIVWRRMHHLVDGHPHVHGANFGVRADVLRAVGGWPALVTGEDVDLLDRLGAADTRIARTSAIPVRTSARTRGRAPRGMSSFLRNLRSSATHEKNHART